MNEKLSPDTITQSLLHFNGTEQYYEHVLTPKQKLFLTDGTHFIREQCEARWLFDLILTKQTLSVIQKEPFQVWTLKWESDELLITCDDGNKNILLHVSYGLER